MAVLLKPEVYGVYFESGYCFGLVDNFLKGTANTPGVADKKYNAKNVRYQMLVGVL